MGVGRWIDRHTRALPYMNYSPITVCQSSAGISHIGSLQAHRAACHDRLPR